jgi:hypothetical protein
MSLMGIAMPLEGGLEWETHQRWQLDMSLDPLVYYEDKSDIENVRMTLQKLHIEKIKVGDGVKMT